MAAEDHEGDTGHVWERRLSVLEQATEPLNRAPVEQVGASLHDCLGHLCVFLCVCVREHTRVHVCVLNTWQQPPPPCLACSALMSHVIP